MRFVIESIFLAIVATMSYHAGRNDTKKAYKEKVEALEQTIESGEHCVSTCAELFENMGC